MKTVDVRTEPTSLLELIELARREAGVLLLKEGQPVAQVLPVPRISQRVAPLHPGSMEATEDFDQPLPDQFWLGQT